MTGATYILPSAIDETLASTLAGGVTGLLSPISFCHWQPDETTNIGNAIWAIIFNGAQIAIAVYNAIKQEEIADKQMDLAESWYSHADYKWERFKGNYMPLEKRLLNETVNKAVPKLDCDGAEIRADQSVYSSYTIMDRFFRRQSQQYRLCIKDSTVTDIMNNRALMLVDMKNYNYADDRWFRDFKDDQRWSRRSNMLNLGRNLDSMALAYGSIASKTFGAVGAQYDRVAQGAMQALGYFGARNDTYMPHTMLGTIGQSQGSLVSAQSMPGSISPTGISPSGAATGSAP